jgi:hypothetical protein
MNFTKETLRLITNIKNQKDIEFWDLDITSSQKVVEHCNNPTEEIVSNGMRIVELDIKKVSKHFLTSEEEQFYVKGLLLKEDYQQYYQIAKEWSCHILLTPPTLIFFEDQQSPYNLPRIYIHDGKHRLSVYRQFGFEKSRFVIPNTQINLFKQNFNI